MIRQQLDVLTRLETESRRDLRSLEDSYLQRIAVLYDRTMKDLKAHVRYVHSQNHPDGKWDIADALAKGTLRSFEVVIAGVMTHFRDESHRIVAEALSAIREREIRRACWMLDQVTPPGFFAKRPESSHREADVPGDLDSWSMTWLELTDAWSSTLARNLRLGAVSSSSPEKLDVVIDGTRVGYPAFSLWDSLNRIYTTAAISQQAQAQLDVADANEDIAEEEVWQTLEDSKVCYICQDYFGEKRDDLEAQDVTIPAHPNDRCFWRIVPREWAEMLRSGDEAQQSIALEMDNQGMLDDAMAIYGADGRSLVGATTVRFEDWDQDVARREYDLWKTQWEKTHPTKGQLLSAQGGAQ